MSVEKENSTLDGVLLTRYKMFLSWLDNPLITCPDQWEPDKKFVLKEIEPRTGKKLENMV